ncbi:MAG: hypothetical protein OEU26_25700 [Candidatus Tectomicrobia bacterium]|nr:hypothetical protein [Candidatus Tectomicrobia bacterium]
MEFSDETMREAIEEAQRQAVILGELNQGHELLLYARGPAQGLATPSPPVGFDPSPMSPFVGSEPPPSEADVWLTRFKDRFWDREESWTRRPEQEVVTVVMHNYAIELRQAIEAEEEGPGV